MGQPQSLNISKRSEAAISIQHPEKYPKPRSHPGRQQLTN